MTLQELYDKALNSGLDFSDLKSEAVKLGFKIKYGDDSYYSIKKPYKKGSIGVMRDLFTNNCELVIR